MEALGQMWLYQSNKLQLINILRPDGELISGIVSAINKWIKTEIIRNTLFCQASKPVISAWPQLKQQMGQNSQVSPH